MEWEYRFHPLFVSCGLRSVKELSAYMRGIHLMLNSVARQTYLLNMGKSVY